VVSRTCMMVAAISAMLTSQRLPAFTVFLLRRLLSLAESTNTAHTTPGPSS
jgi:hypothetical protein